MGSNSLRSGIATTLAAVATWIAASVVAVLQDVVSSLIMLLKMYSVPPALASSASSTADASPQSDAQPLTSSEHAQTAQQSYETQKSLHTKITQGVDLLGGDQSPLGLIQHWHTKMQPMILSSLLACLPQDHVFSEAMFADCKKWYIQVAENLFLMGQQQEPWLAIPFITPYLHMMRTSSSVLFDSTHTRVLFAEQMTDTCFKVNLVCHVRVIVVFMITSGHIILWCAQTPSASCVGRIHLHSHANLFWQRISKTS